ncbi:MAG: hypothetical protein JW937_10530, partial [Candidatus Omnitrophica bacterium]|nr:hypothetical protein [Candidatus Omnitrophota bacterium]
FRNRVRNLRNSYVLRHPMGPVQQFVQQVDELARRLEAAGPIRALEQHRARLQELGHRMHRAQSQSLERCGSLLRASAGRLEALSPLKVLLRGYSLTYKEPAHVPVRSVRQLKVGDEILTHLQEGQVRSRVEEIKDAGQEKD